VSEVAGGALARMGCLDADAIEAADSLLARVADSEIETIRVVFPDQHGLLRGKTIVASALRSALRSGLTAPSTLLLKDTAHRTVFPVWSEDPGVSAGPMQGANDILIVPDATTFRPLPWAPHSAWLLADVRFRDGTPIPFASRSVLQRAVGALGAEGLRATMGLEVEFYIFQQVTDGLDHAQATAPGDPVMSRGTTQGYQYLTETRYDAMEPLLDKLRRAAQGLGLPVRSVEIEFGPSQFEMTFDPGSPMEQADNMVMFRTMVKELCAREGYHASFMAKPKIPNLVANGWHVHQSISDAQGRNLFMPDSDGALTPQADGWLAGLLTHATEASLLMAPTINSYKRYQPFQLAPNRIAWGRDNRGAMLRALLLKGDAASRIENRAPDSSANPYYAFAAQLTAGLAGMQSGSKAPPGTISPYDGDAELLPTDMGAAIAAFDTSDMFRKTLGDDFVNYLVHLKRAEWSRYLGAVSDWEHAEYFNVF
jgi:glutamine synthetase